MWEGKTAYTELTQIQAGVIGVCIFQLRNLWSTHPQTRETIKQMKVVSAHSCVHVHVYKRVRV